MPEMHYANIQPAKRLEKIAGLVLRLVASEVLAAGVRSIPFNTLQNLGDLSFTPAGEIMSRVSKRATTRVEDQADLAIGLFDVGMPLLYGAPSMRASETDGVGPTHTRE
ncbi:hypothetical protein OQA88_8355 [Cercophora sp. LCS_1]